MLKLFRYLRPYRLPVAAILVLAFLQSLSELYLPTLMSDIVDEGVVRGDTPFIWRVGALMLLVAAGGMLASVLLSYLSAKVASGFGRDLRSTVFARVESFSLHEFDKLGTSTLITRTTNDITQVQQVMIMSLRMMLIAPMIGIGGIIMAVSKDPTLSLVIVAVVPILIAIIGLVAWKGMPLFKAMQLKLDTLNRIVREGLTGIRVIRAFNRTGHETGRFTRANRDLMETAVTVNRLMASMMPLMMLILNLTSIAIVWFGAIRIDNGHMQVGDLMAFIQYVMQIMFSMIMVTFMFVMVPRASASAVRINEVLQTEPLLTDPVQPRMPEPLSRSELLRATMVADSSLSPGCERRLDRGHVEFRNVSFSYPGAEQPAISGISFAAGPGEVTAIIGGTGSGKSTLVGLIPRFYDPQEGSILVDGLDVREMAQADLRRRIGFVPQTAMLFSGSVADNLRYGKEEATADEVRQAAETAQATEFIDSLAEGFEAPVSQGGTNLSGGQKQRLTIARALVRRPEIYIFDDNFSALDFKTDARLRAALREETAAATVFIVAQRVSTVMDADRIIVLEEGSVAGMGTHRELLRSCQVYREIVASQLGEEELA